MHLGFRFLIRQNKQFVNYYYTLSFLEAQHLVAIGGTPSIKLQSYLAHIFAKVHTNLCAYIMCKCIHSHPMYIQPLIRHLQVDFSIQRW